MKNFFVSNIQTSLRQACVMHIDLFSPAVDDSQNVTVPAKQQ